MSSFILVYRFITAGDTNIKVAFIFTDSYKYYLDQGFLPSLDSECTYCLENPLSIDDVNSIIDHILVRPPANENKMYSAEV